MPQRRDPSDVKRKTFLQNKSKIEELPVKEIIKLTSLDGSSDSGVLDVLEKTDTEDNDKHQ